MRSKSGEDSTVIGIDSDRNSHHAVKWALEHLILTDNNSTCTLIHVQTHNFYPHDFEAISKHGRPPTQEEELQNLFLPFRGFCARKGIVAKELVLHGIHVSTALTDYIIHNSINNIVVGASRSNALIRKFKDVDVPTTLVRSLPESCMVHVISKGKVQNIRPTGHSSQKTTMALSKSLKAIRATFLFQDFTRKSSKYGHRQGSNNAGVTLQMANGVTNPKLSDESCFSQNSFNQSSFKGDTLNETSRENQLQNSNSFTRRSKSCLRSSNSLDIEIRQLKLEQERKIEKCNSEVAIHKIAMKNEKFMQEEDVVKAWVAEEATMTLSEVERKKTKKTAMEIAIAEMESQKKEKKQSEKRAMHEEEERNKASAHNKILFKIYNIKEIEVATNYFDNALKIGEGGYGPVFKGVIDNTDVAIKALKPDISQGERQFQQEVNVLSKIRHPNMVQLLGACPEYGCLVYEYIENGSLEDCLFQKDNTTTIPWKVRFRIASEIATGLLSLHQTKPEAVVHRDLKPANILLDRNYVSKISDVGLARLVPPKLENKSTQYHKTTPAGTFFYIDPEYQQTGLLGVKSDLYALGVMLLQIITGKPPMGVAHLVQEAIDNAKFPDVLDPNVTDWPLEDTLSYARLALKCCEMRKRDRPDLASVILPELIRLRNLGTNRLVNQVESNLLVC